LCYFSESLKT